MRLMKRCLAPTICAIVASSCGGDEDAIASPPSVVPFQGAYPTQYRGGSQLEVGTMFVAPGGKAIYHGYKSGIGHGTWVTSMDGNQITLTMIERVLDEAGNEFPAAFDSLPSRTISLAGNLHSSTDWTILPAQAVRSGTITGSWRFNNLFVFDARGERPNYTVNFSIDAAGNVQGADSNDCRFTGQHLPPNDGLYPISILAHNCGATGFYIDNYLYDGYLRLSFNGVTEVLELIAVNPVVGRAIHFQLTRN